MTPLADLGPRIVILGPSNSGKSTLADAINRKLGLPVIHLDQLHHLPNSNWVPRPADEFLRLHDAAIAQPSWAMEGNYGRCLPQRLERATGVILLDVSTLTSLVRYLRRTWFDRERKGALKGGRDSVKWSMIHHIAAITPTNRQRYKAIFEEIALPKISIPDPRALAEFYRRSGLDRLR